MAVLTVKHSDSFFSWALQFKMSSSALPGSAYLAVWLVGSIILTSPYRTPIGSFTEGLSTLDRFAPVSLVLVPVRQCEALVAGLGHRWEKIPSRFKTYISEVQPKKIPLKKNISKLADAKISHRHFSAVTVSMVRMHLVVWNQLETVFTGIIRLRRHMCLTFKKCLKH